MLTPESPEPQVDEIRGMALAAIRTGGEQYSPNRYPYTYSADFLRAHTELIPAEILTQVGSAISRADAALAKALWSESIGVDERALAQVFADCYLLEHGIPLGMANTDRYRPLGASDSSAVAR